MVMNKPLFKEFLRTIKNNLGRFLSIVAIIALGVGFFAGINATKPDMIKSAAKYYEETNLMDLRAMNPLGYSPEDIGKLKGVAGITAMQPSFTKDLFLSVGDFKLVARLFSLDLKTYGKANAINQLVILEGRLPENSGEIIISREKYTENPIEVGSLVKIEAPDNQVIEDILRINEFTVVGIFQSPLYVSVEKEQTNVGSGKVGIAAYVPAGDFKLAEPTEYFFEVAAAVGLMPDSDSYQTAVAKVKTEIDGIGREVMAKETAELKQKLLAGKAELLANRTKAETEIKDAEDKLIQAETDITEGEATLLREEADGKQKIADGRAEVLKNRMELLNGRLLYNEGFLKWSQGNTEYLSGKAKLDSAKAQLDSGRMQLDSTRALLAQSKATLDASVGQLDLMGQAVAGITEIMDTLPPTPEFTEEEYNHMLARVEKYSPKTADYIRTYIPYSLPGSVTLIRSFLDTTVASLAATYDSSVAQYNDGLTQYEDGLAQYEAGEAQYAQGLAEYEAGASELEAGKAELDAGKRTLDETKKTLDDGDVKLDQAILELDRGETELTEKVAQGKLDLEQAKVDLAKGKEEFTVKRADALKKLAEADDEILKAERDIADVPDKWFVTARDGNPDYSSWFENAEKIGKVATVFPFFFFLVAALVSLTNITRIVEEERTQTGTLKALGYGNSAVSAKYILYALIASLLGSAIGLSAGFTLFPTLIIDAYSMMYNIPKKVIEFNPFYASLSLGLALLTAVGAAVAATLSEIRERPAHMMQPKSPPAGKRILLERITPLWKWLSFSRKVTFRNLFLYKKRFWMTIIGIAGCTALILTGFGIKNSVDAMGANQFKQLFVYNQMVVVDDKKPAAERNLEAIAASIPEVKAYKINLSDSIKVHVPGSDRTYDANLIVPETPAGLDKFIVLRERVSKKKLNLNGKGAVISEKLAVSLNLKAGDEISYEDADKRQFKTTITGITENYLNNYLYLTSETYQKVHLMKPNYNGLWVNLTAEGLQDEKTIMENFMKNDSVITVFSTGEISKTFEDQMNSLVFVVFVLVVAAGALAFIVLYNLSNVNITERQRELATIKVLGFRDNEVTAYVYRENIFLTLFGALTGLAMGFLLHKYIIVTLEIDNMMFGKSIHWTSYLFALALTFLFSAIVNVIMHFALKRINMVESLKSIE